MGIITECLVSTFTDFLPVLSGIAPTSLPREHLVHRIAQQAVSFDGLSLNIRLKGLLLLLFIYLAAYLSPNHEKTIKALYELA